MSTLNGTQNPDLIGQAEAEAGVATTPRLFTAERVKQAIAAQAGGGGGGGTVQGVDGTYDIQPTNEGVTAGNARGENSVDLCTERSNALYVCAGANSGSLAGENNGGTGTHTAYLAGLSNYSNTGNYCSISGSGHSNNSGNYCHISGSINNSNSGHYCNISGSDNNNNAGSYCSISGSGNETNSGTHCSISGAYNSSNIGNYCNISGYLNHSNSGAYSSISGLSNSNNASSGSIIGGKDNDFIGTLADYSIIGGELNSKTGADSADGSHCLITGKDNYGNSGNYCSISGSSNHSNTGSHCLIAGFNNLSNSGSHCSIWGYGNSYNTGTHSSISGIFNISNSGDYCSISGSNNLGNSGNYSLISGEGNYSNTGNYCNISGFAAYNNNLDYARVHGGGADARIIDLVAKASTTDATPKAITLGGAAEGAVGSLIIPVDTAWAFVVHVVAIDVTNGYANSKKFSFDGLVLNDGGTVTVSSATLGTDATQGTFTGSVALSADVTNDALRIVATGIAATTVRWTARVELTQVD